MTTEDANRLLPRRLFDDTEADLHFIPLLLCCHCYCYSYCSGTATATAASLICTMIASAFASRVQPSSFSLYFGRPMAAAALVLLLAFCRLLQEDGGWRQASATFASGPYRASHKRPLCMVATPPLQRSSEENTNNSSADPAKESTKSQTNKTACEFLLGCLSGSGGERKFQEEHENEDKVLGKQPKLARDGNYTMRVKPHSEALPHVHLYMEMARHRSAPSSHQNPYDMVYSLGR